MPFTNGKYSNPGWVNGTSPAISASELNAISDALERVPVANGGTGATTAEQARINLGFTSGIVPISLGGTGATTAKGARTNLGFPDGVVPISMGGTGATAVTENNIGSGLTLYKWGKLVMAHYRQPSGDNVAIPQIPSGYRPAENIHLICPIYASSSSSGGNFKDGYARVFIQTSGNITIAWPSGVSANARFDVMYFTK